MSFFARKEFFGVEITFAAGTEDLQQFVKKWDQNRQGDQKNFLLDSKGNTLLVLPSLDVDIGDDANFITLLS